MCQRQTKYQKKRKLNTSASSQNNKGRNIRHETGTTERKQRCTLPLIIIVTPSLSSVRTQYRNETNTIQYLMVRESHITRCSLSYENTSSPVDKEQLSAGDYGLGRRQWLIG